MTLPPVDDQPRWLVATTPAPRPGRHRRRRTPAWRRASLVASLAGLAGLAVALPYLVTTGQALFLAHSAAGMLVVHAGASGAAWLLRDGRSRVGRRLRHSTVVGMAAGAWIAVLLGTWSGYPSYLGSQQPTGSLAAEPRAWLHAHGLAVWDLLMTVKVVVGWLSPLLLTAVAVAVLRDQAVIARDPATRRLVGVLLAAGLGAAAVASAIGVGVNIAAPNDFLR